MKIVQPPKEKQLLNHWSIGRQVICVGCGATLELEYGDAVITWTVRCIDGDQGANITCPCCETVMEITHLTGNVRLAPKVPLLGR